MPREYRGYEIREIDCAIAAGDLLVKLYQTEREFNFSWIWLIAMTHFYRFLVPTPTWFRFRWCGYYRQLPKFKVITRYGTLKCVFSCNSSAIFKSAKCKKITYHLVGDFDEKGSHTLRSVIVAGDFYPCFDGLRAWTSPRSQIRDCLFYYLLSLIRRR